ncbi:MAG: FIST N-terminal domain-containing protein [Pseudomonadota bacterium]
MDAPAIAGVIPPPPRGQAVMRSAVVRADSAEDAVSSLAQAIGTRDLAVVMIFFPRRLSPSAVADAAARRFAGTPVVGCTTAGEIAGGYLTDAVLAIGLPKSNFVAATRTLTGLASLESGAVASAVLAARMEVSSAQADWPGTFAMLLVDGLSRAEDTLVASITPALGAIPLFGGSAGDGLEFEQTFVLSDGVARQDAAVIMLVQSRCPVHVFRFDHFRPTDTRMVVTKADPARRLVSEINAEPAAVEYARIVGLDPGQLGPFAFAAHPVVVRLGGQHHVRAIQKVEKNGDLRFFSAIDEGLVLRTVEPLNMAEHLDAALTCLARPVPPAAILGCDCVLRRLEAEDRQMTRPVSDVLARFGVVGFSTYGEQHNGLHVNQTFTGVALYPPGDDGR